MAKFQKINDFCDRAMARMDELGDAEIQRRCNTPEAKVRQAAFAKKLASANKREAAKLEARRALATTKAQAAWNIGDAVVTRRGERGVIAAIDGWNLVLNIDGKTRKFSASMVTPA